MVLRSHPGFEGLVNVWLAVNHESEGIDSSASECHSSLPGEEYQAWYHAWHHSPWGPPMCALCICVPNGTACSALQLDGATNGRGRKKNRENSPAIFCWIWLPSTFVIVTSATLGNPLAPGLCCIGWSTG